MEVIAFVGPSGTGKSHRALVVAHENGAECIIDDGILIHNNRIVAGFSAKKEESRLKAVRRAIFQDPEQVRSVKEQLDIIKPKKILILGTSENMVGKISSALDIGKPERYIHIEDIASSREIEKAQNARLKEGKHIIPVPTMELKPHFKGYLIDPIKSILRRTRSTKTNGAAPQDFEKSVVRPVFSYYGRLTFSDQVIEALIKNSLSKVPDMAECDDIKIKKTSKGTNALMLDMGVSIYRGRPVKQIMNDMHKAISNEIEYITGMSVERLSIVVDNVVNPK
ncbi:hypothetical protein [Veillonella criceti]|uniref:Protein of uncharacterized function (DUF322) n=1 Tax=Veillonella criceti TaxID=103891 RepID=A0A380NHY7_9FIRM|nr:hypothetical protein [Veillonella criceti]SUP41155.1 Protein of uncharacterised function (DUF322) [Veillonella criceti]